MNTEMYLQTRAEMSAEELRQYEGQWVAFSADGTRVIAAATTLAELDQRIISAGDDPETVGLERIVLEDSSTGGADLS